jgi:tetratricopeptide (TPR) repeat protein
MKSTSKMLAALATLFLSFAAAAQTQPATSASELQMGIEAYKNAHYEDAIQHFERATELDPNNVPAHMYLATACASQYIPSVDLPDNDALAERAIDHYQHVLDSDAGSDPKLNSAKGIAYLYLSMQKIEDSKKYYEMAVDLDPKDPEPYYSLGVIDWTESYQPRMEERAKLGMKPEEHLSSKNKDQYRVCDELRAKSASIIEEGIDSLKKAIDLRPDYDDAMAYLNLMYRERADLECDNPAGREDDLKTADDWVDETLATKKAKAEKTAPTAPNPQ